MRLERLHLARLPGIEPPFALELGEGAGRVHLVVGPNGSGKSSLARALRAVLWPAAQPGDLRVAARFRAGGATLAALREGEEVRWERDGAPVEAPRLPDPHLAPCFTLSLVDLLALDSASDRELARRVHLEMLGRYDLAAVRAEAFELRPRHGAREARVLAEREAERAGVEQELRALARAEEGLARLAAERGAAGEARDALPALRDALERAEQRREREAAEAALAAFPPGVARLRGDELERLERLEARLAEARAALAEARGRAADARRERERAAVAVPAADVADALARARELRAAEPELWSLAERYAAAEGAVDAAREALAGSALAPAEPAPAETETAAPDRAGLDALDRHLRRAQAVDAERAALEAELAALAPHSRGVGEALAAAADGAQGPGGGADGPEGHGVDDAAAEERGAGGLPEPAALVAAGLVLAGGAVAVGGLVHPAGLGGLGLAAGVLLVAHASARGRAALAARGTQRRRDLERRLAGLARREAELERSRAGLRRRLGVDPRASDLALVELARRLADLRAALGRRAARGAELSARRAAHDAALAELGAVLAACGRPAAATARAVEAELAGLEDRARRAAEAERAERAARAETTRHARTVAEGDARRVALYADAGLADGDRAGLEALVAARPAFAERRAAVQALDARLAALDRRLAARPELDGVEPGTLRTWLAQAERSAARGEEAARELGVLEERVARASAGRRLEEAVAAERAAREALERRRAEALAATAGRALLAHVEREHERTSRPAVVRRAAELLARFTDGRYELVVGTVGADAGPPELRAVDARDGRGRSLAELSDGTRVQLLLAARLAFAESAAAGARPPLVLDEVLGTADPERFDAVARALLVLAAEGWQVLYLTAVPAEVERWRRVARARAAPEPEVIDLGAARGAPAADGGDRVLRPLGRPAPQPAPGVDVAP